jgi:hypothetical protein
MFFSTLLREWGGNAEDFLSKRKGTKYPFSFQKTGLSAITRQRQSPYFLKRKFSGLANTRVFQALRNFSWHAVFSKSRDYKERCMKLKAGTVGVGRVDRSSEFIQNAPF